MSRIKSVISTILLGSFAFSALAQDSSQNFIEFRPKTKKKIVSYLVIDGDSIPLYQLDQVIIRPLKDSAELANFIQLRRNIIKVLPYAKLAAFKLQLMEDNLKKIKKKRDRKRYVKQVEKEIKKEFMKEMRNLTMSQGKLLLKLIHRETGKTTWEIMSNYSNSLDKFFWQAIAKTYNSDMKVKYDPARDWQIDFIIRKLELE